MKCGGERRLESSEIFLAGENERAFEAVAPKRKRGGDKRTGSKAVLGRPISQPNFFSIREPLYGLTLIPGPRIMGFAYEGRK
jgi:hypothetical protein